MTAAAPEPLDPRLLQLGGDGRLVAAELVEVITNAITNHPRSQQVAIGPSEIGDACARRIGYKLLQTPGRDLPPNWKATVGTAMHAWLEGVFTADNEARAQHLGGPRWYLETRLTVGFVPGMGFVEGSCDLYDRVTGTVVDWKLVGPSTMRKYRSGPGERYSTQAHLYGRGWQLKGLPVERVMIVFLARNGELRDAMPWSEPYDPAIAEAGLQRLAGIHTAVQLAGPKALDVLPAVDDWCSHCSFYRARETDLSKGCPGVPGAVDDHSQLNGLLP